MNWAAGIMARQELRQEGRPISSVRAPLPQLVRHILGNIARPSLRGVERDNPDAIAVLAINQIANDRLIIGVFFVRLSPNTAKPAAELIEDEINVLVVAWMNRGYRKVMVSKSADVPAACRARSAMTIVRV